MGSPEGRATERVVLVVDDEETLGQYTARVLASAGFRALVVHSGAEAVALLGSLGTVIWLVISDIEMPGITGVQVAAAIEAQWPEVQVLLVSGRGRPPSGYDDRFLRKPFMPSDLIAAVQCCLRGVPHPGESVET